MAIDLATFVIYGVKMVSVDASYLAVFSVNIAFSCHFVWLLTPPSTSIRVLVVLAMPVKPSKMAGNSAIYPFNSWCIDR